MCGGVEDAGALPLEYVRVLVIEYPQHRIPGERFLEFLFGLNPGSAILRPEFLHEIGMSSRAALADGIRKLRPLPR
jgi:hypothetical protein